MKTKEELEKLEAYTYNVYNAMSTESHNLHVKFMNCDTTTPDGLFQFKVIAVKLRKTSKGFRKALTDWVNVAVELKQLRDTDEN